MTHLNISHFAGSKRSSVQSQALLQYARTPYDANATKQEVEVPIVKKNAEGLTNEQQILRDVETLVVAGRQHELVDYFKGVDAKDIPIRVGEWELRINVRRQDNVPVSRTIIALPLTVRTRATFERGCMAVLKNAGYSDEDAKRYYKAAWKKKYVWLEVVVKATLEMIEALNTTAVLDSYLAAPDARKLAHCMQVPKSPYRISHTSFLAAVEMARLVILARGGKVRPFVERIDKGKTSKPSEGTVH